MDVHLNNLRYLTRTDHILIHAILSADLMTNYGLSADTHILRVSAQIRKSDGSPPSPYCILWGKFVHGRLEGIEGTDNFYVSIPIAVHEGHYDPFSLTVLRFHTVSGDVYIPFFHLTLWCGLKQALASVTIPDGRGAASKIEDPPKTTAFDILLQKTTPVTTIPQEDLDNPLCLLRKLLQHKREDECPKHHQGLENPGQVRGHNTNLVLDRTPKDIRKPHPFKKGPNIHDLQEFTSSKINHIFSDHPIQFLHYPHLCSSQTHKLPPSIMESMDQNALATINPLKVVSDELNLLYVINSRYIKTWETYLAASHPLLQPGSQTGLHRDHNKHITLEFLQNLLTDALYLTYQSYTQINSTITSIAHSGLGCWADIVPLDIRSSPTWSLKASNFPLAKPRDFHLNPAALKDIQQFLTHIYSYVILSDSNLNIWLVLPGGNIIPGYVEVTSAEKTFLRSRYG
ncbi:viral DNA cleavage/packaging protein [Phascolarctid gammaherpesvirus 1]|uniref:Viral DNA cleavage/packaging protein n=1 Tax=Phascolarctid gammaherpesvirus 1 TaxID=2249313 RepID=A0A3Q8J8F1_9GAMA|nr:viral DNA cleavage/packaging protein [Phascolarctid gammaherpesvirus 1]AZB49204.1 viral DNA cleavage/packaging protein [Phascolarctid gammaherpesvirus 1]